MMASHPRRFMEKSSFIVTTAHKFYEGLCQGRCYFAKVAIVSKDAEVDPSAEVLGKGRRGKWVKSRPFEVKEDRPAIAAEVRRAMWAAFYTDTRSSEHQRNGCMLAQACIGCKARRGVTPMQLSPLLDNVHAAHIIADAKGGPHGDDKKQVWNFFPLCKDCNLDMKTTNAIDWLYQKCSLTSNWRPLFEVLFRLWRARYRTHDEAGSLPENLHPGRGATVIAFALAMYKVGLKSYEGGEVEMEGATLTHEPTEGRDGGGFTTTKSELFEAFAHLNMTSDQMNSLIDSMDKTAEQMQTMANKLSVKIQEAAERGFHEMARVETQVKEAMQTLGGKIDGM